MNVFALFFKSRRKRAEVLDADPLKIQVQQALKDQQRAGSRLLSTITEVLDENAQLRAMMRERQIPPY